MNGKVERSQKTDFDEFYSTVDLKAFDLEDKLQEWQHFYNWNRPHGSHGGLTPIDKYFQIREKPLLGMRLWQITKPKKNRCKNKIIGTKC